MLYELLSLRQVTTMVQYLRRLVDELTPLLKDEMENLPPQQRKIIHALMEKGGTAQPTDLTGPTRLPLNAITTQLKRLKDAQIVEVLGGGKGRAANYTVPDKLFSIWYQMRYLSQNRRRIEMFVEVLRVWFEADERVETLRKLTLRERDAAPQALRDSAATAEYFAASLKGTAHERLAADLCIGHWVAADLREAALAYADFSSPGDSNARLDEPAAHLGLSNWLIDHGDPKSALKTLDEIISKPGCDLEDRARALFNRGLAKGHLGDTTGELADYTAVIELEGTPKEGVAWALFNRGVTKRQLGDMTGALADYTAVIELEGAPQKLAARALVNRGATKGQLGDTTGALADYTTVIELEGAPKERVSRALLNRGTLRFRQGQFAEAREDLLGSVACGIATGGLVAIAAETAFVACAASEVESKTETVLQTFATAIGSLSNEQVREMALRFLNLLAGPDTDDLWPSAYKQLIALLKPEVAEAIRFLEPVCRVLEGNDRTLLDALPPEQREFAVEVLTKFEPKPQTETPKSPPPNSA
jgi:tetratricopeptide (TPR) repeat protein